MLAEIAEGLCVPLENPVLGTKHEDLYFPGSDNQTQLPCGCALGEIAFQLFPDTIEINSYGSAYVFDWDLALAAGIEYKEIVRISNAFEGTLKESPGKKLSKKQTAAYIRKHMID